LTKPARTVIQHGIILNLLHSMHSVLAVLDLISVKKQKNRRTKHRSRVR